MWCQEEIHPNAWHMWPWTCHTAVIRKLRVACVAYIIYFTWYRPLQQSGDVTHILACKGSYVPINHSIHTWAHFLLYRTLYFLLWHWHDQYGISSHDSLGSPSLGLPRTTNGANSCWGKGYMSHLYLLRGIVHLDVTTLIPQLNCRGGQYFWLLHITTSTLISWNLSMIHHNIKPTKPKIGVGTTSATTAILVGWVVI
jgi:hypothetical protein